MTFSLSFYSYYITQATIPIDIDRATGHIVCRNPSIVPQERGESVDVEFSAMHLIDIRKNI